MRVTFERVTYQEACEAHSRAFRKYDEVRKAYQAREIGDKEFLAARKEYDLATDEYDRAYRIAANY
jgi:hypothetical protein